MTIRADGLAVGVLRFSGNFTFPLAIYTVDDDDARLMSAGPLWAGPAGAPGTRPPA